MSTMVPQSEVEQLMVAEVTPHIVQGEQLMALGSLLERRAGQRALDQYDVRLVVATNLRLLLLEGKSRAHGTWSTKHAWLGRF